MGDNKMKYDYTKYKVGDPLWSMQAGEVTVHEIGADGICPVQVLDSIGRTLYYTVDGRYRSNDPYPSLFPEMPEFPEQPQRFEQDQPVVLPSGKIRRYAMYSEGEHYVYMDGRSSKSSGPVHSNTFAVEDLAALAE